MQLAISNGFSEAHRRDAAQMFWDAFRGKLGPLLLPGTKAISFLTRVLDPTHAISAVDAEGNLLGIAGFKTEHGAFVGGGFKDLATFYGFFGALWRAPMLALLERETTEGVLLMDGIYVSPVARGKGVGSALLAAIKAEAGNRGLKKVRLDVIDSNPRARALYEREGFLEEQVARLGPLRHIFGFNSATTMIWTSG